MTKFIAEIDIMSSGMIWNEETVKQQIEIQLKRMEDTGHIIYYNVKVKEKERN